MTACDKLPNLLTEATKAPLLSFNTVIIYGIEQSALINQRAECNLLYILLFNSEKKKHFDNIYDIQCE